MNADALAAVRECLESIRSATRGARDIPPLGMIFAKASTAIEIIDGRHECSDCYGVGVVESELCPLCKGKP